MSYLIYASTVWRVPLILLWTALMASLSMILSIADKSGQLQHGCARRWSRCILAVSRVKVDITGLEKLDSESSYIFVANHLSMFDHWAFLAGLPFRLRFAAKASLFRWPFLGWHLRRSGSIPVSRRHHRATLRAFQAAAKDVEKGTSFVIYPEGTRTLGETVAPFKRGSLLLARYASAPVVPVTIVGAHRRLQRGSILIRPGRMRMLIHSPMKFNDYHNLDLQAFTDEVRNIILESYQRVS